MNTQPPDDDRPRLTVDQIARDAADLIDEARDAGLTPPCAINCHDYTPPAASLFVSRLDTADIWDALQQWAARYDTEVTTRPTAVPENTYASAEFDRDGVTYEVYTIIRPDPQDYITMPEAT